MCADAALTALGFRARWQQECADAGPGQFPARIARIERGHAVLWSASATHELDLALYPKSYDLAVGDWLLVRQEQNLTVPVRRLSRYSSVSRRAAGERADRQLIAANLDTLFIVSSCNTDFSLERLERYLVLALEAQVKPVVVLTKADRCEEPDIFRAAAAGLREELEVVCLNALDAHAVAQLQAWCGVGQTVAMVGSSGVGKSTLTNVLADERLETQSTREGDDKGRHTTTSRSLHRLRSGGLIIDTPGMRELQLPGCADGLEALFAEVVQYLGQCRFNDCQHASEPGCAIRQAIAAGELDERRWNSYAKLHAEQAINQQGIADRAARAKAVTAYQRKAQSTARRNKGKRPR